MGFPSSFLLCVSLVSSGPQGQEPLHAFYSLSLSVCLLKKHIQEHMLKDTDKTMKRLEKFCEKYYVTLKENRFF